MVVIVSCFGTKSRRGTSVGAAPLLSSFLKLARSKEGRAAARAADKTRWNGVTSVLHPLAITRQPSRDEPHPIHANDATRRHHDRRVAKT